jgi:ubiquinone/menaquinone biosynthesis C-methylase UbiE
LDWRTYDSVANIYAKTLGRELAIPAADLVKLAEVRPGARVLDVGTGTGGAARAAAAAGGEGGLVIGVDPAYPMISIAHEEGGMPLYAAATAIDLPFRNDTFGFVLANFVLSHFARYETALFDMLRVLRAGGRMAVTSWGAGDDRDEFSAAWEAIAEEFAEHEMLQDAHDSALPWEERFSDRGRLKGTLHDAGLRDIWVEQRDYRFELTADEYLSGRDISSKGRFLRQMLGEELWEVFRRRTREIFAQRFPARLNDFRPVIFAVGHKPAD